MEEDLLDSLSDTTDEESDSKEIHTSKTREDPPRNRSRSPMPFDEISPKYSPKHRRREEESSGYSSS